MKGGSALSEKVGVEQGPEKGKAELPQRSDMTKMVGGGRWRWSDSSGNLEDKSSGLSVRLMGGEPSGESGRVEARSPEMWSRRGGVFWGVTVGEDYEFCSTTLTMTCLRNLQGEGGAGASKSDGVQHGEGRREIRGNC